ncbi:MAG: methyltransferase domain-containing protein [Anaerolineales bacterium]|nr:methyltransferase domain-containing protein [Anaerolineales bacterium]
MYAERVKNYYTGTVRKEWNRLIRSPYFKLEFDTTMHFLEKYLPKKGRILDAGGGPGRYTVELAKRGYRMTLLDLTPANLEFARRQIRLSGVQNRVEEIVEGSITDLSRFEDETFDAVICTGGPLSHILESRKRNRAVRELIRVAKRRAPVFVSVMSRLSVQIVELTLFPFEIELPFFKTARDTGDYPGTYGFTACHFFLPEEFQRVFQNKGVKILEMAGLEGLSSRQTKAVNALARHKKRRRVWMETHLLTCTHPAVVGMSEHMLIVCRKLSAPRISLSG